MNMRSLPSPPGSDLHRFEPWREFVIAHFSWRDLECAQKDTFRARVALRDYGERSLASIACGRCHVCAHAADRSQSGYLEVLWQHAGSMRVEQDRSSTLLQPGMATICDAARPYQLWLGEDARFTVLTLPHGAISGWERLSRKVCATALADRVGVGAAAAAAATLLQAPADTASANAVLNAIEWMLSASLRVSGQPERTSPAARLEQLHQHVLSHIDDPDLGPEQLASVVHVSRRTLYLLFKERAVTPVRFIRDVRLEAVRDALASPHNAGRSIFAIALDHGFNNHTGFSRAFKAAFGMNPSEWRQQQAATALSRPMTS